MCLFLLLITYSFIKDRAVINCTTRRMKNMKRDEICQYFNGIIRDEKDISAGMAAIRTLLKVLEHSESETVQELQYCLQNAVDAMRSADHPVTSIASGSELFLRFITLATLDTPSFAECKGIMIHRGKVFYEKLVAARGKVAKAAAHFITDGSRILTHSKSRVVLHTMKEAAINNKIFKVYVTASAPDNSGYENILKKENVSFLL